MDGWGGTYNLELDRHNAEVYDLHGWPHQVVGFERWDVDVLEFASYRTLAATLSNGHKCEEARQTCRW